MKARWFVGVGVVGAAVAGILAGFFWRGHDETRAEFLANATLIVMLAGAFLVVIPRLTREMLMMPRARRLRSVVAVALAGAAAAMVGVGITASAPRPVIAYVVICGGLGGLLASGALWVSARRVSD